MESAPVFRQEFLVGRGHLAPHDEERLLLARTGTTLGLVAALLHLAWSVLPLPGPVDFVAHALFGPLVMCGFIGLEAALRGGTAGLNVTLAVARIWGVAAGICFTTMTVVQSAGITLLQQRIGDAPTPSTESARQAILSGVATVPLGLEVAWDIFVLLAAACFATVLLFRPGVARMFGVAGVVVGVATLVLDLATFPVPPREAGLIDGGPWAGGWFLGVSVFVLIAICRDRIPRSPFPAAP